MKKTLLMVFSVLLLTSCEQVALMTTPAKQPQVSHSQLAATAKNHFWASLHKGAYDDIDQTTYLLTAAYLQNPNDPDLAAYLGFSHIWKLAERQRLQTQSPLITDQIILAKKYFRDATVLNPSDARLQGFLGVSQLVSGDIFHDQREEVKGYFQLKRSIHLWPEFNYFTAGYSMSNLDAQSAHFKEGLDWQWKTLSLCAETPITPSNPDFSKYMSLQTLEGPKRVCWNSWIAPHNFEGFFLNMGDMLVKSGDWQTAIQIYKNAKLSSTYSSWPYRHLLENRIQHAKENVANFQQGNGTKPETRIMFNSGYGCMACHQARGEK